VAEDKEGLTRAIVVEIDENRDVRLSSDSERIKNHISVWMANHGKDSLPEEVKWEIFALDVRAVKREEREDNPGGRFRPMWTLADEKTDPPTITVYPDVEQLLNDEKSITYYKKRLEETTNPIRKARYADLVWVSMQKQGGPEFYRYGMETARAYLAEASLRSTQGSQVEHAFLYLSNSLDRAAEVAVQLNARDFLSELTHKALELVSQMPEPERYRWVVNVSKSLLLVEKRFRSLIPTEAWTTIQGLAVRGVAHEDALESRNLFVLHELMGLVSQICVLLEDRETAWRYRVRIAESFEKEARVQENSGGKLAAYKFMENALHVYQQLLSLAPSDEEKRRLREQLVGTQREVRRLIRLAEGEMKRTSISVEISGDELEELVKPLLEVEKGEALTFLSHHPALLPNIEELRRQSRENAKKYPLLNLLPTVSLRDGRKVGETTPGEEATPIFDLHLWFQLHYRYLDYVFYRLREEGRFTAELYVAHLRAWEFFDEADARFIEIGLERYFADDCVSALHVLTPRVEHMLKSAFEQAGFPSVAVPNKKQIREETLGDFLRGKEVRTALGEDLWHYLYHLLVDERGFNLRNDIAHGWIEFSNCNRIPVQIVLFAILQLTRLKGVWQLPDQVPAEQKIETEETAKV
jgi:hypothetical protein